jgi:sulfite reductase (NADPH) flavoprotein alpha-component
MEMSPIPKTAPFADEEIDLLNRVVGTATPVQRAWLAGFLAGLDASRAARLRGASGRRRRGRRSL